MLLELSVVEQPYQAVLVVVRDGWNVTEVGSRLGVSPQSVHNWIARYEQAGLAGRADRSRRPNRCPHQIHRRRRGARLRTPPRAPRLGTATDRAPARKKRGRSGPARSSIYRCLKRHGLIGSGEGPSAVMSSTAWSVSAQGSCASTILP